jgi:hypothetical protein
MKRPSPPPNYGRILAEMFFHMEIPPFATWGINQGLQLLPALVSVFAEMGHFRIEV